MAALIEENHQGGRLRGQGESLNVFRNGDVVEAGSRGRGDFDFDGDAEEAHAAFDLVVCLTASITLVLFAVVGVAQVEFRRACTVQPLLKNWSTLVCVASSTAFGEIGRDNVFAAIHFEIALEAAVKSVFANLVAKHVEDPACFIVSVAVEFAGVIEVVAHDRLVPEIAAFEPLARVIPALVVGLILAEVRFGPYSFQERGEALVEPDVAQSLMVTRSPNHWWPSS